jgi:hypothetical protein
VEIVGNATSWRMGVGDKMNDVSNAFKALVPTLLSCKKNH